MSDSRPKSLDARLVEAQRKIVGVATSKQVASSGGPQYKYASTESIVDDCRGALAEVGLSVSRVSSVMGDPLPPLPPTKQGNAPRSWCKVTVVFAVCCSDTQEQRTYAVDLPAIEGGGKSLDKAVLGCMTSAMGYFIVGLLLVPRLDENEISARHDEEDRRNDPAMGDEEAERIRSAVSAAGLKLEVLLATALSKNPDLPGNIALWPRSRIATCMTWIEKEKKRLAKGKP